MLLGVFGRGQCTGPLLSMQLQATQEMHQTVDSKGMGVGSGSLEVIVVVVVVAAAVVVVVLTLLH